MAHIAGEETEVCLIQEQKPAGIKKPAFTEIRDLAQKQVVT
jgi:hypothetical protein